VIVFWGQKVEGQCMGRLLAICLRRCIWWLISRPYWV